MMNKEFDKSVIRSISISEDIPITKFILDSFYRRINVPITLLGISPISISVVEAGLYVAKQYQLPIMFIASLNQVDIDGGYTGWTPHKFVNIVKEKALEIGFQGPIIVALDHGGPWLKDSHVHQGLTLEESIERVMKSIEAALIAGYDIIHIDTTIDIHSKKPLEVDIVAKRTLDLIEFTESFRRSKGLPKVDYEIGSDRWGIKDPDKVKMLIRLVKRGLAERGLNDVQPVFVVGDIGTRLHPENVMDQI